MGMTPGQKNVLVRVVLRRLERTLTDSEANQLRDRISTEAAPTNGRRRHHDEPVASAATMTL